MKKMMLALFIIGMSEDKLFGDDESFDPKKRSVSVVFEELITTSTSLDSHIKYSLYWQQLKKRYEDIARRFFDRFSQNQGSGMITETLKLNDQNIARIKIDFKSSILVPQQVVSSEEFEKGRERFVKCVTEYFFSNRKDSLSSGNTICTELGVVARLSLLQYESDDAN